MVLIVRQETFAYSPQENVPRKRYSSTSAVAVAAATVKPVKRVCIVGAGIAGLSLAHGLVNYAPSMLPLGDAAEDIELSIFDARPKLDYTAGSGVQLNGGIVCLGKINPKVQQAVIDGALPICTLKGGHKSWSGDGVESLWEYDIADIVRGAGKRDGAKDLVDAQGNPLWYGIMRGAIQETLLKELPVKEHVRVEFAKRLTGITSNKHEGLSKLQDGAFCHFSDGTMAGPLDLVVGCDGIKSVVKEFVEKGAISNSAPKLDGSVAALYSGIRINYAVQDGESPADDPSTLTLPTSLKQTFANGAYAFSGVFGNGIDRPPCNCFFVTSLDNDFIGTFRVRTNDPVLLSDDKQPSIKDTTLENADWTQNVQKPKSETRALLLGKMRSCGIVDDAAASVVMGADRFFELGVYFHSPLSFSGWSREVPSSAGSYAVLCGDAAHAMPPFLGAGANQAIQGSYSLALRIHNFNAEVTAASQQLSIESCRDMDSVNIPRLGSVLKEYEKARWSPTASITAKAAVLGYLETGGKAGYYSKFRDLVFRALDFFGVPKKVLVDSILPKV